VKAKTAYNGQNTTEKFLNQEQDLITVNRVRPGQKSMKIKVDKAFDNFRLKNILETNLEGGDLFYGTKHVFGVGIEGCFDNIDHN